METKRIKEFNKVHEALQDVNVLVSSNIANKSEVKRAERLQKKYESLISQMSDNELYYLGIDKDMI